VASNNTQSGTVTGAMKYVKENYIEMIGNLFKEDPPQDTYVEQINPNNNRMR